MARGNRYVLAILAAGFLFLFRGKISGLTSGLFATPPAVHDVSRSLMTNQTAYLNSMLRSIVAEEHTNLRREIVQELTSELKTYIDAMEREVKSSTAGRPRRKDDAQPAPDPAEGNEEPTKTLGSTAIANTVTYVEISSMVTENCLDTNPMDAGTVVRTWACHHGIIFKHLEPLLILFRRGRPIPKIQREQAGPNQTPRGILRDKHEPVVGRGHTAAV